MHDLFFLNVVVIYIDNKWMLFREWMHIIHGGYIHRLNYHNLKVIYLYLPGRQLSFQSTLWITRDKRIGYVLNKRVWMSFKLRMEEFVSEWIKFLGKWIMKVVVDDAVWYGIRAFTKDYGLWKTFSLSSNFNTV